MIFGISLEAYLGVIISFMIIKAGVEILRETLSKILGERIDASIAHAIKRTVVSADPEIRGAFDLVLNNYGPDKHIGSVHIEVPDTWTADKIDAVARKISAEVYEKHYETYAHEFGKTILGFFSDEPMVGNIAGGYQTAKLGGQKPLTNPWQKDMHYLSQPVF